MKIKTVEEEWREFSEMAFSPDPPTPELAAQLKTSFFAGACGIFFASEEVRQADISEAEAESYAADRKAEFDNFLP